jgi:hypothetical protein
MGALLLEGRSHGGWLDVDWINSCTCYAATPPSPHHGGNTAHLASLTRPPSEPCTTACAAVTRFPVGASPYAPITLMVSSELNCMLFSFAKILPLYFHRILQWSPLEMQ